MLDLEKGRDSLRRRCPFGKEIVSFGCFIESAN